jgi:hypothetical protein
MPARPCLPGCECGLHNPPPRTPEWKAHIGASVKLAQEAKRRQGLPVNGHAAKTKCPEGHRYSGVDVNGSRVCRICRSHQSVEYRARVRLRRGYS